MKTKSTQVLILRIVVFILICLYSFLVFGQSGDFQNCKLKNSDVPTGANLASTLYKFSGIVSAEKAKLQWSLATGNNASTVVIEKGHTSNAFKACAEFWVNFDGNTETNFQYADKKSNEGPVYYRLKIIAEDGKIQYSDILHLQARNKQKIICSESLYL